MRDLVVTSCAPGPIRRVAGIDAHVAPAAGLTWAAVAVVAMPELELVESALAAVPTGFPYVPAICPSGKRPPRWRHWPCCAARPTCS